MMLTPQQRRKLGSAPKGFATTVPSPIGGWNTRDALDAMDPTDAVILDNWFPDVNSIQIRNGWESYATGLGSGHVETLAEYFNGGDRVFIAAANNSLYDISAGGAVGAPLASGYSNNRWQTVNFKERLFLANGQDAVQSFNGTAVSSAAFSGPSSNPVGLAVYQARLFLWERNSQKFWYGAVGAVTGSLTSFDLSTIGQMGGYVMCISSLSQDGGSGLLEYLMIIMSTGEVFVYQGTDPGDADNFQLLARYKIAPPVNIRSVCRYGAEAYLTTYDDVIPLSTVLTALKVGEAPPRSKISGAVAAAVQANANGFGWQTIYYPKGRRLICNVPNANGSFYQHVYNTTQKAWCRFINMNGTCFGVYDEDLYFGGRDGKVYLADTGNMDGAQGVAARAQPAWNSFEQQGGATIGASRKRVGAVRPILQTTGSATYSYGLGYDFNAITATAPVAIVAGGSPWDVSPWDTSAWSPEVQISSFWRVGGGSGQSVGILLEANSQVPTTWLRTDWRLEIGNAF